MIITTTTTTRTRTTSTKMISFILFSLCLSASISSCAASQDLIRNINNNLNLNLIKRADSCGNGKLDDGEECDFSAPDSKECCSKQCKKLPSIYTSCNGGRGVCDSGLCKTRSTQCSQFNQKVLSVNSGLSLQGPYVPCDPVAAGKQVDNAGCTLACSGNNLNNGSDVCLDLGQYSNINNVLPDGITCLLSPQSQSQKQLVPGVCFAGTCTQDACRKVRCTNHGQCIVGSGNQVKCQCESGYSGDDCSLNPSCDGRVDSCGVCNGDHTSCAMIETGQDMWKRRLYTIIIPACAAALVLILIIGGAVFFVRRNKAKKSQKSSFNVIHSSGGNVTPETATPVSAASATGQQIAISKQQAQMGISVKFDEFKCIAQYEPVMPDELELRAGDVLFKLFEYDDGWAKGYNTRTGKEGVYPVGFTERIV